MNTKILRGICGSQESEEEKGSVKKRYHGTHHVLGSSMGLEFDAAFDVLIGQERDNLAFMVSVPCVW